jgi:hypothetical protein
MPLFYFIAEPDQPLIRLPLKVMEELSEHRASLPDYAGKRIRVAEVRTVDDENGAPYEIGRVVGFFMEFDGRGLLPADIQAQRSKTVAADPVPVETTAIGSHPVFSCFIVTRG